MHWAKEQEKGNKFVLKLTFFLVKYCPKFLLDFVMKMVAFFYFCLLKKQRQNIRSYRLHVEKFAQKKIFFQGIYKHFLSFSEAICDKFAVYQGKITLSHVKIKNKEFFLNELLNQKKGQILLVSHFGNIEISNALSKNFENFALNILVYDKNSLKFNTLLNSISGIKLRLIYVDELDINSMMKLKELVEKGEHIGIMGDRVALNQKRVCEVDFLGQKAFFSQGAYLMAALLKCKISTLWCEKINGVYEIELLPLSENITLSSDKSASVLPHLKKYVKELEKRCLNNPYAWFNFYDFWRENDRI